MINQNFVILGAIIEMIGGIGYIRDTLRGKVQPNRVSWGLWALTVAIAFIAEVKQGVGIQALTTFMVGFMPLLIFIASFVNKKAYWKVTMFDLVCGLLSIVGLVLWITTKVGNLAIGFSIVADLAAGIPTLVKAFQYPESENWFAYAASFTAVSLTILTLKTWSFAYLAYPLYVFCYDLTAVVLIKLKLGKVLSR